MAPSTGKSRVTCAIAALFSMFKDKTCIRIAFSSDILHKKDRKAYEILSDILPKTKFELSVGTKDVSFDEEDLLILDEADWHLFDDINQRSAPLPRCKAIIGLTATSLGG